MFFNHATMKIDTRYYTTTQHNCLRYYSELQKFRRSHTTNAQLQ